jgi:hypothetical protein
MLFPIFALAFKQKSSSQFSVFTPRFCRFFNYFISRCHNSLWIIKNLWTDLINSIIDGQFLLHISIVIQSLRCNNLFDWEILWTFSWESNFSHRKKLKTLKGNKRGNAQQVSWNLRLVMWVKNVWRIIMTLSGCSKFTFWKFKI